MLATDAKQLPDGDGWAYEIKWDGVRAICRIEDEALRIFSRSGAEVGARYPELGGLVEAVGSRAPAVLDGEIVALDSGGRASFQDLQQRMGLTDPIRIRRRMAETPVTFMAFDALMLDGEDLTSLNYLERRERLAELELDGAWWQVPRHHLGDGPALLEVARRSGLEGVVAKRTAGPYRPGERSREWVKVRIKRRQDFVIGGWLPGHGGRAKRLGSLMLGVWDGDRLIYAGKVGSGLSEATITQLSELLEPLRRSDSPFEGGIGPKRDDPVWCEPELVCAVEFSEWTREGTLRQPSFKGLRDDIDPRSVVRE